MVETVHLSQNPTKDQVHRYYREIRAFTTSEQGEVEHTIPVFDVGASFFRPLYTSSHQWNALCALNDSVIQTLPQVGFDKEKLGQFSIIAPECSTLQF